MKQENIDRLITDALAIEQDSAKDAGTLGYMARAMVQATMPHKNSKETTHKRRNGDYHLTMMSDPDIGLPYGSAPRLMLAWIGAEVLRTGEQEIVLGDSMSAFMAELGMMPTGGRWGTITRLKDQSRRLFGCVITCSYSSTERFANTAPFHIGEADLWWSAQLPEQLGMFQSRLRLSDTFYREIREHSIPVDMRVLQALRRSPMALDVYAWTTYRIYTLNRSGRPSVVIPWLALQAQFGAGYAMTPQGTRNFRKAFLRELDRIRALYWKDARIAPVDNGLKLSKSRQLISSRKVNTIGG